MNKKGRFSRRIIKIVAALSLLACAFFGAFNITYALINQDEPNVVVQIDKSGNITQNGDLFGKDLLYPGIKVDGILRIQNSFKRINAENMGIKVNLVQNNELTEKSYVYDSFVNNMRLTIAKGRFLVFDEIIFDNKSFADLLVGKGEVKSDGSAKGSKQFFIDKGDSVDLKYTLSMDEDSGDELENLSANVAFLLNVNELPGQPSVDWENNDGNKNKDNDNNDSNAEKKVSLIEEPLYTIPNMDGHWAHDCIIALIEHDILDPDSESRIRPDDYITRAEAAVLMGRALKLEESTDISTGYRDSVPTWAKGYVIATTEAKVFKGYPGKVFKSYWNITREEMTAVLIRAFREDSTSEDVLDFVDEAAIARWAYGNVAASAKEGIVTGYTDNTFRPKAYMTRAETFTIVCKLLGYHELHNKKL